MEEARLLTVGFLASAAIPRVGGVRSRASICDHAAGLLDSGTPRLLPSNEHNVTQTLRLRHFS